MTSKWFRTKGDESDEEEESEESKSSKSESEEESEESESSKSESEGEESESDEDDTLAETAPKANRFLKSKQEKEMDDSDEEDVKAAAKIMSKDAKRNIELDRMRSAMRDHIKVNDVKAIQEDVETLTKKYGSATEVPDLFLTIACMVDRWLKDREAREEGKPKDKEKAKALAFVKQKVRKVVGRDDVKGRIQAIEKLLAKEEAGEGGEEDEDEEGDEEAAPATRPSDKREKGRAEEEEKEWKPELIERKLQEVLALRGKRGTDKAEQIEALKRILLHTSPTMLDKRIQLLIHLTAAWYDATPPQATHMPASGWRAVYDNLLRILNLLGDHPELALREADDDLNEIPKFEKLANVTVVPVEGNLMGFMERLDDEFTRALQFTDPHTQAYVERLADEVYLMDALERVHFFYKSRELHKHAARLAARILDHLYYRRQENHVKMLAKQRFQTDQRRKKLKKQDEEEERRNLAAAEATAQAEAEGAPEPPEEDAEEGADGKRRGKVAAQPWWMVTGNLSESMIKCTTAILKHGDEKAKSRALLCKVYHLALHDQYNQARDIVLMSHIHDIVMSASPGFQILFNRSLAQLGMAAFRLGQFRDVHICLNELCASQRVKELLAQGTPNQKYQQDRKPEEEKQNKMKLCPFHVHINLDVLEAVSLVAAMLLEVPMIAANPYDSKRKVQSKAFNKLLNHYESQVFLGPPENTRDHIYAATRALLTGDWQQCLTLITELPVWDLVPHSEQIKTMLRAKVKEEGLRTYLLQYGQYFDTVSLSAMAAKFELAESKVHSIISKMIFTEELSASWDQPAACISMHRNNPSKLQYLCMMMADKANTLVENNEKILDSRAGGFGVAYKVGQDVKPTRPSETLWGNFNRWSTIGTPSGAGIMRRQQATGQRQTGGTGAFGQMGRQGQQGRQQTGRFQYSGGFSGTAAFGRNRQQGTQW